MNKTVLILFSSLFMVLFDNFTFFQKSFAVFDSFGFMFSLGVTLSLVIALLIVLLDFRWSLKPLLVVLFLVGAVSGYFVDSYGVIIDDKMVQNLFETDASEAFGLINLKLFIYLFFLGVLPSIFVIKLKLNHLSFFKNLIYKLKMVVFILVVLGINIYAFSKAYTTFGREYKILRFQTNPTYPIYSFFYYLHEKYFAKEMAFTKIGKDAKLVSGKKPKLFIFVVGEALRWDHFELNGYPKQTNPMLKNDKEIVNLKNFFSCGTETAVSVPCMFSDLTRKSYSDQKAKHRSSLVDVLNYAGVRVLWKDNNSDSKGVALRIKNYVDIKNSCDGECRDEKLLEGLDEFVREQKDTFIVLHQMGSHGPEYYKRTDEKFKKFKPECKTNQLQKCSKESISNAYDNTVVYTDYFISKVKEFLKKHKNSYQVGLWYSADHGESLGEKGIYLHGLPYFIAPEAQKHPASLVWFGDDFEVDRECLRTLESKKLSHDNIFSSVLGVMGVKTKVYDKSLDIFVKCYQNRDGKI